MSEDSLKKRYTYKLGTNLVGFVVSFITVALVTRSLGPATYGDFGFLTNFFTQLVTFIEAGTSFCFYNKLTQRPNEPGLIRFYWGYGIIMSFLVMLFVQIVLMFNWKEWLWPNQKLGFIWMAALWGMLMWFAQQFIRNVVDAHGLTVQGEIVQMQQRIIGVIIIAILFWIGLLNLSTFFLQQYLIFFLTILGWRVLLQKNHRTFFSSSCLKNDELKRYSHEFYLYSGPLVVFAVVVLVADLADRWLLQTFAGSIEQGFYTLSFRIGAICLLFTSAMTPLIFREFSRAFGQDDFALMRRLFQRYVPMLYAIAAYFAIFVSIQSDKVSLIFGGQQYATAGLAVGIMVLYPIHQTYGQLGGSLLMATGQTKLVRNLGSIMLLIGFPYTFFLIAPTDLSGLNLGATGLALKMVSINILSVNLQLWYNTKQLQLPFWKYVWHQIYVVFLWGIMAFCADKVTNLFIYHMILNFIVSGGIYTFGCFGIAMLFPSTVAFTRTEMYGLLKQGYTKVRHYWMRI